MSARRRKHKLSSGSNPPASALRKKGDASSPRRPLSRRRKWLFRLVAMVLVPVVFFGVLEAGLRLGGYGYPTAFLVGPDADGVYTSNPQFAWRFFPRNLARKPVACFLCTKPADTVRIFILGSSAAQGVPEPSFSFGSILEAMLRERHPGVKFEVVNAAMTAINSHVVREIARDCAAHQPDLFVVYMGNNEVVGPYGPGTIFQQWSPSLRWIRANVWLKSARSGQLLDDAIGWFRPRKGAPTVWQGMEMFTNNPVTADDPRLPAVYDNFRQNLRDICAAARRAGAGVILSTVAVNLKDCPPLASLHRSDLSAADLAKWDTLYRAGVDLEGKKKWPEAIAKYEEAAKIDDRFAELAFRRGRCLAALTRWKEAREQFGSARDLDALRFRADSRINEAIRDVAAAQRTAGVRFVDAEQSLAKSDLAVGGIPGENLFYEHVHFTFDGNYLLARAILEEVEAALPQLAAASNQEPVSSREQCAEWLVLTPWDESEMARFTTTMTARPPFTDQLDHAARQASEETRAADLDRLALTPQALQTACAAYKAAIEKTPDDWRLHYRFGMLALAAKRYTLAAEHLRIVRKGIPWDTSVYNNLGAALSSCGRFDEAIAEYEKALAVDSHDATAHYNLGVALRKHGRIDEALGHYEEAIKIDPAHALAHINLADLLGERGRHDEAVAHLRKALEIDPNSISARTGLGNLLRSQDRLEEAIVQYQKAAEIDPGSALLHHNLAVALNERGRTDEAIDHYQAALRIDPGFAVAHNNLGEILRIRGQLPQAIAHLQKALILRPDFPEARAALEKALKARGQGS